MVEENGSASEMLQINLNLQNSMYNEWLNKDSSLRCNYLLIQSFRRSECQTASWQCREFVEEGDYDYYCHIRGPWEPLPEELLTDGLELKQHVVLVPCKLQLRSLAVEIKIRLKLSMHSSFYIMPRVFDEPTSTTPVLKLVKDANLRGLFFVFASINPANHKFTFIKQHQIPEMPGITENFREIELVLTDNGDDKIFISLESCGRTQCIKQFSLNCSGFVPELRESRVFMAGAGDGVYVKSISVQYRERILNVARAKRTDNCVCCIT